MPVIIRNKNVVPLTLPFPFRGIIPPGGAVRLDLTEAEVITALAIAPGAKTNEIVSIRPTQEGGEFAEDQTGNATQGLLIGDITTAVTTDATGTVVNVGAGVGIFRDKILDTFNFKSLVAGTNITITPSGSDVLIIASGTGEANTASNVGAGSGIFKQKALVDLEFRSLTAGANVTLTPSADEISIAATGEVNSAANVGTGAGVFRDKTGITVNLKSIKAGANVTITPSADELLIASTDTGEVNTASNVGVGAGIFKQKSGVDFEFKSLVGGTNIGISVGADALTLSTTAEANLGANVGAGSGLFRDKTSATLNFKSLTAGANVTLTPSADSVEIASAAPGETNTAANVGTGSGIFRDKTGTTINLRSLKAGANITLTPVSDEITIAAASVGGPADEVAVLSASDFPTPSAGVITLDDNKRYRIFGSVSIGADRLVMGINSSLLGRSPKYDGLVYTGTGNMITAASTALEVLIKGLTLTASSGTVFDINGPADFELRNATIIAGTIGDIDTTANAAFGDVEMTGFDTGPSFSGTGGQLTMRDVRMTQTTGGSSNRIVDLGSATFDSIRLHLVRAITASGGVSLGGLASGGNVNSGGTATVNDSDFNGAGTALATVTTDDLQWLFVRVLGVLDSQVIGFFQQNSGLEVTVVNGPTKLNITTTAGTLRRMTHTGNNTLRFDAPQNKQTVVSIAVLLTKVSGGDFVADIGIAVNGTIVARVSDVDITADQESLSFSCPLPTALTDTDIVELFTDNSGGAQSLNIRSATLLVEEI